MVDPRVVVRDAGEPVRVGACVAGGVAGDAVDDPLGVPGAVRAQETARVAPADAAGDRVPAGGADDGVGGGGVHGLPAALSVGVLGL